jgi:peptide/nickel transport system permease protein
VAGYVFRRLLWGIALFFAVTIATYVMFFVIPTEPGRVGRGQAAEPIDLRNALGIQGPIYEEYAQFLSRIAHGSFGESYAQRRDVRDLLFDAAPVTMSLILGSAVLWLLIAFPIGVLSALRPRSLLDRTMTVLVLIGISTHPVWMGLILSYFLAGKLHAFPLGGYCDLVTPETNCGGPVQWAWHLILPWVTFALLYAAIYTRMIRASVLETVNEDYVRTARAKGASSWIVLRSHVLRNAMLPVVTMVGMDVGVWVANAIFVERVFALPGLGGLLASSLARRDLPVIMAIVVFVSILVVVANLLVDLLYAKLDPRVRLAQSDYEGTVTGLRSTRGARSAEQPVAIGSASQPASQRAQARS